jgi:hypothetical protein
VPSHPELHPQGALGRRLPRVHRAGERQPDNLLAPRSGRTRSPSTARCCRPGTPAAPRPGRATSWASRRHARIDPARHGDHQEGAAARHPRAVHADAAAGSEDHQTLWKQGVWMDPTSTSTTCITASSIIPG